MDLVRSWLGQALRATGAAVVVPGAILVVLSLTAAGGAGLGGLGALSQVVSGPQVAGSDVKVDDGRAEIADAVTQLAAGAGQGTSTGTGGAGGGSPGVPDGGGAPNGTVPNSGGGGGDDTGGNGDVEGEQPPGGGGGGNPPAPGPPPPPPPGAVEGVGQGVKDVTAGTPVAPTVEDAVDGLIETCRRLRCP